MEGIRSVSSLKQPSVFLLATAGLGPTQAKHDRDGLQWLGNLDLMPVAVESSQMVAVLSMALMAATDNVKILLCSGLEQAGTGAELLDGVTNGATLQTAMDSNCPC